MNGFEFEFLIETRFSRGSRLTFEPRLILKCRVTLTSQLIMTTYCLATLRECFPTRVLLGSITDPLQPFPSCTQKDITDDGSGTTFHRPRAGAGTCLVMFKSVFLDVSNCVYWHLEWNISHTSYKCRFLNSFRIHLCLSVRYRFLQWWRKFAVFNQSIRYKVSTTFTICSV